MTDYQGSPGQKNDTFYWILAVGLILPGIAAPVGVLMIVMKLLGGGRKRQQGRHPYYQKQYGQDRVGARTAFEPPAWEESAAPAWEDDGPDDTGYTGASDYSPFSSIKY